MGKNPIFPGKVRCPAGHGRHPRSERSRLAWVSLGGCLCTSHLDDPAQGGSVLSIRGQLAAGCRPAPSLVPMTGQADLLHPLP